MMKDYFEFNQHLAKLWLYLYNVHLLESQRPVVLCFGSPCINFWWPQEGHPAKTIVPMLHRRSPAFDWRQQKALFLFYTILYRNVHILVNESSRSSKG